MHTPTYLEFVISYIFFVLTFGSWFTQHNNFLKNPMLAALTVPRLQCSFSTIQSTNGKGNDAFQIYSLFVASGDWLKDTWLTCALLLAALAFTQCRLHRCAVRVVLLLAERHVIKLCFTIGCTLVYAVSCAKACPACRAVIGYLNRAQFVRHIEHLLILEIPING